MTVCYIKGVTLNNDFVAVWNFFIIICFIYDVTYDDDFVSVMFVGIRPDNLQRSEGRQDALLRVNPNKREFFNDLERLNRLWRKENLNLGFL
ncbi:MAG TPA: hypothetical protein VFO10_20145 [Oligoflexus sp.]|uniref:hypothetical protein n=1 Tax=Oligoflexus sp. TaxID=1971216 RepID=UPI002D7F9564|nr:hypothetical protein [Oligoflexus sp.]HET9239582.1 hypothetical protein [Oligoflexus sp.]